MLVAENPEVLRFPVSCVGIKPQLEIDKHAIQFDRLLLQRELLQHFSLKSIFNTQNKRKESKQEMYIWVSKDISPISLAWKVINPDALGEGFTVSKNQWEGFTSKTETFHFLSLLYLSGL